MSEETRSIVPRKDGEAGIGREDKYWGKGYFNNAYIKDDVVIAGTALKDTLAAKDKNLEYEITKVNKHFTSNEEAIRENTNNIAKNTKSITDLSKDVNSFKANVGSPFVAHTVADMTDKNKIYVYTGSEAGYTKGNWYYNNGTTWVSGGVYNSSAVETDTTLSIAGMAADSEACGKTFSELKSNVNTIHNTQYPTFSDVNGYVAENGAVVTSTSTAGTWMHSSPIKVDAYKTIIYKGKGYEQAVSMISITDANGNAYEPKAVSVDDKLRTYTFHTGENDCYISISYLDADKSAVQLYIVDDPETKANSLYSHLQYTNENVDVEIGMDNKYVYATGALAPNNHYVITTPFTCNAFDTLYVFCKGVNENVAVIAEVHGDKYTPILIADSDTQKVYKYTVPHSGTFVVSYEKEYALQIRKASILSSHPKETYDNNKWAYSMWKILCIGDSLTSGAAYSKGWEGASIDQNYPRILGRMLNAEVTNGGISGYTPKYWYEDYISKYNFADYDTFIIWLGTNEGLTDTLDADVNAHNNPDNYANTNTGCYCKIIEAIKKANKDCLIVLTKVFASSGNQEVTNNVIDKIAEKYRLLVIDNSDLDQIVKPELHAGLNNPHFGKAGNAFVANRFIQRINEWISEDPLRSEFGYTARTN